MGLVCRYSMATRLMGTPFSSARSRAFCKVPPPCPSGPVGPGRFFVLRCRTCWQGPGQVLRDPVSGRQFLLEFVVPVFPVCVLGLVHEVGLPSLWVCQHLPPGHSYLKLLFVGAVRLSWLGGISIVCSQIVPLLGNLILLWRPAGWPHCSWNFLLSRGDGGFVTLGTGLVQEFAVVLCLSPTFGSGSRLGCRRTSRRWSGVCPHRPW